MEIWIPAKLYHALPLLCIVLGVLFLCISSGGSNFVLCVLLIAYGCWAVGVRLATFYGDW